MIKFLLTMFFALNFSVNMILHERLIVIGSMHGSNILIDALNIITFILPYICAMVVGMLLSMEELE